MFRQSVMQALDVQGYLASIQSINASHFVTAIDSVRKLRPTTAPVKE